MKRWIGNIVEYSKELKDDQIGAFGGQAAFFLFLSVFPMASILLSLTQVLPYSDQELIELISRILPEELELYIAGLITDIYGNTKSSVTIISILIALWSSAKGIMAIRNGLNKVYSTRDDRNYFLVRGISMLYTLILLVIIVLLMVGQVFGLQIVGYLVNHFPHLEQIVQLIYQIQNVGTLVIVFLMLWLMYRFLPGKKLTLRYQAAGAFFVSIAYLVVSRLFSLYVKYYSEKSYMYGSITMIIMVLLWLYFFVTLILFGGVINEFLYKYVYSVRDSKKKANKAKEEASHKSEPSEAEE